MSLVCIAAVRWRVIPFWLAVTVAVLGGLGTIHGHGRFHLRIAPAGPYSSDWLTYEDRSFNGR